MSEINVRHAVVVGLALNRNCSNTIDEIYYKNEKLYHNAYLEKGFNDDYLKKIFTMKTEDRINKLSGIIEVCYDRNDFILIEKVIKKAHPSIVNFVKKSNVVDIDKFSVIYGLHGMIEDEQFSIGISLIYLANLYNKQITGNNFASYVLSKWHRFLAIMSHNVLMKPSAKEEVEISKYVVKGYDLFYADCDTKIDCSLEQFISEDIERKTFEKLNIPYNIDAKLLQKLNIPISEYEKIRGNEFNIGVNRYIGCFSRYLHSLGLDSGDIFVDTKINNEILEDIFKDFYYGITGNNINEQDIDLYVASCLFIYNLVALYKECKDIYLNQASEDKFKELQSMESKLNKEIEKFKEKEFSVKLKIKESNSEIGELKKKLKELEKENNKLSANAIKDKELITELKTDNATLKANISDLQECLNNIDDLVLKDNEVSLEDKINFINKFNIGIFGGMNNINKLSDKLTNVTYYNSKNQDISSIDSLDMIFINSSFINHAFSYKIKSASSKFNIPMNYVSGTNSDIIISTIYNSLKNKNSDI